MQAIRLISPKITSFTQFEKCKRELSKGKEKTAKRIKMGAQKKVNAKAKKKKAKGIDYLIPKKENPLKRKNKG